MTALAARYRELVEAGELRPDTDQEAAIDRLVRLSRELETAPRRGSVIWRALGKKPETVRGVYLWGGVGRGKSMLMDMFYACLQTPSKRRVHFHEFMLDIHDRLRQERAKEKGDPVLPVADAIRDQSRLLALDEMVVNNTADAAILSRLFTAILAKGVTIVTTSNRPPSDLYKDGLNRELFLPFIDLIEERLEIVPLNGPTDYRLDRLGGMPIWYVPNGDAATAALREAFFRLTDYSPDDAGHVPSEDIAVPGGRTLHVPKSLKGVAVFSFKRLCAEARGAPDYLAIARRYHTVVIVGIPVMGPEKRNEAARFKTLIDALYEYKVKLLAAADAEPAALYESGDGAFEFERTASRLIEMQSADYMAAGHGA
ncbi:MAG: cell division protein ZapE [Pseudomonadota bacterium]